MGKKIILYIILIFVSLVFFMSAYFKLYPIEPFELSFVDSGFVNWQLAPFFARILIAIEVLIGTLLLLNLFLQRFTYRICIYLLSFFTLYLIIQLIMNGNSGNCGCFGDGLKITTVQGIIKNIFLIILILILRKHHKGFDYGKHAKDVFFAVAVIAFALPFILNPVSFEYSESYLNRPKEGFELKLDLLYENATLNVPPKTLSEGKHIIAFMSLTCPHCRLASKKMRIIHDRNPDISFYFVLNGKPEKLDEFFDETGTRDIPHCKLKGKPFVELGGLKLPTIYLVNNSIVEHSIDYYTMSEASIIEWINAVE